MSSVQATGNNFEHAKAPYRDLAVGGALLVWITLVGTFSLTVGDFPLTLSDVLSAFDSQHQAHFIVADMRLPRLVTAVLVGASLGMAGAIIQTAMRNPLGSPELTGVSGGASFGIVAGVVIFALAPSELLLLGTLGGLVAGGITYFIGRKTQFNPIHLTLAGMCVSLFFVAATTLLLVSASADANGLYYWLTGNLMNRTWVHVSQLFPFVAVCALLYRFITRPLNIARLGDQHAHALGFDLSKWRLLTGIIAILLTAATVAVAGPISFVGLVAPHVTRLVLAERNGYLSHERLLPFSSLVGITLLVTTDLFSRLLGVPVGILCLLMGGPVLIVLIRSKW